MLPIVTSKPYQAPPTSMTRRLVACHLCKTAYSKKARKKHLEQALQEEKTLRNLRLEPLLPLEKPLLKPMRKEQPWYMPLALPVVILHAQENVAHSTEGRLVRCDQCPNGQTGL
jgi:hypothetical protein